VKVIGCDLFLDLDIFNIPKHFLNELKENYIVREINTYNSDDTDISDVEIYFGNRINLDLIERMPNLKWIHFGSVGVDKVLDMNKDIIVTNSKGTMDEALSCSALSLMFSLARGVNHCYDLRFKKDLSRNSMNKHFNKLQSVYNQKILIVGCGSVGNKVSLVCEAMGMDVLKMTSKDDLSSLCDLVKDIDFVLNLLPYTKKTKSIFNKKVLGKMKNTSYIINIGRGETMVEKDLVEALQNNWIGGAGLDVFQNEQKLPKSPLNDDSPLWDMDNVIITPHIAGWSNDYWSKQISLFKNNLKRYEESEEMLNIINLKRGY
jgi:phosphoglycerate dehydrogenase-like enzyme